MEEKNTNATKRRNPVTWVPSVYFAMGLPFVVLNMVTVLMFKGLDISDAQIALWTSVIMLPWTLKPLWSPFLEMYRTKKFFVVLTQLLSGCLFGLVALALNLPSFFALSIALLGIIALSGATHDVATDGVYMKELSTGESSQIYRLARCVLQFSEDRSHGWSGLSGGLYDAIFYRDRIGERGHDIRLDDRYAALRYDHDPAWFLSYEDVAFGWKSRYRRTFVEGKYG